MTLDFDFRSVLHLISAAVIYIGVYSFVWVMQRRRIEIKSLTPNRAKVMLVVLGLPAVVYGVMSEQGGVPVAGAVLLGLSVVLIVLIGRRLRSPGSYGVLACLALTVVWELIVQPWITVYGGPARGYIQGEQVIAELAGLLIGMALIWKAKPLFTSWSQRELMP